MNNNFAKSVGACLLLLLALLAIAIGGAKLPAVGRTALFRRVVDLARERHSYNFGESNGYYETLMTPSSSQDPGKFLPVTWLTESKLERTRIPGDQLFEADPFLIYKPKPNLDLANTSEGDVKTNAYGFFDRPWSLVKPAGTRRIAVFGDSVIRGTGVTYDQRFESLLENKLNASGIHHYEILNFAVGGYMLTQMFGMAMEKAPPFHPDVYVIAVTDRTGNPIWAKYLAELIKDGHDLRYDVLRKIVAEAEVTKEDSTEAAQEKLAPYRVSAMRAIFLELKAHAERQSAKLVVFFVPSLQEEAVINASYLPVRESLQGTGIPVIDASHAFSTVDHDGFRLDWFDQHPNVLGHQMIAKSLYEKLCQNPEAWADIVGQTETSREAPTTGVVQ